MIYSVRSCSKQKAANKAAAKLHEKIEVSKVPTTIVGHSIMREISAFPKKLFVEEFNENVDHVYHRYLTRLDKELKDMSGAANIDEGKLLGNNALLNLTDLWTDSLWSTYQIATNQLDNLGNKTNFFELKTYSNLVRSQLNLLNKRAKVFRLLIGQINAQIAEHEKHSHLAEMDII
ncbi:hypothetical protein SNEBB_005739 [Seison nebaliae]|nr:hypothetical protein SNEBB_005739 [Seison nebaliae]